MKIDWFSFWILFVFMSVPPWGVIFGLLGLTIQIVGLIGFVLIITGKI